MTHVGSQRHRKKIFFRKDGVKKERPLQESEISPVYKSEFIIVRFVLVRHVRRGSRICPLLQEAIVHFNLRNFYAVS